MEETGDYILIGQYFSYEERESVRGRLKESEIDFLINSHGPNFELEGKYYEIKVKSDHIERARNIIRQQKGTFLASKEKCPKCRHPLHKKVEKMSTLEKLIYMGTELVQCQERGAKYGI
jgi:hypothetical protein